MNKILNLLIKTTCQAGNYINTDPIQDSLYSCVKDNYHIANITNQQQYFCKEHFLLNVSYSELASRESCHKNNVKAGIASAIKNGFITPVSVFNIEALEKNIDYKNNIIEINYDESKYFFRLYENNIFFTWEEGAMKNVIFISRDNIIKKSTTFLMNFTKLAEMQPNITFKNLGHYNKKGPSHIIDPLTFKEAYFLSNYIN